MKITELWKKSDKQTISFELFPPRSARAAERLEKTIDVLAGLKPDFASVTFGAGGSTRKGSFQLLKKLIVGKKLDVIGYFAGYGLGPEDITGVLDSYQELGIENILIVRGDIPRDDEGFTPHPNSFEHASSLMEYIRPKYNFCLGVAAYPEGHIEAESKEKDLEYLKLKVDQGAEYIITNYTYDNRFFYEFLDRCHALGINVPIVAGVMPIYSEKMMDSLAGLCGATITSDIRQGLGNLPEGDKEAVLNFGIEFAYRQCKDLLKSGVPGLHIYTMNRYKTVAAIVTRLRDDGFFNSDFQQ
jgi:methylenetetrahydrofolate reductase (NADPH)